MDPDPAELLSYPLEQSRQLGFLGPGSVSAHISHALAFVEAAPFVPNRALDLGAGGGVPGLVLAAMWPGTEMLLLDANARRTAFLAGVVLDLGWGDRIDVVAERAEVAGRVELHRGGFDLVVARSFGPPAVTAECAAPFLRAGGVLLVSEPPEPDPRRWSVEGLRLLGLSEPETAATTGPRIARFSLLEPCPERYPRRTGVPAKRPLF